MFPFFCLSDTTGLLKETEDLIEALQGFKDVVEMEQEKGEWY